jgi:sugar phosphate isomerase/epimerase
MKLSYPVLIPDTSAKVMAWCEGYQEAFRTLKKLGYEGIELLVRDPLTVNRDLLDGLLKENQLSLSSIGTSPMQKEDKLFLMDPDQGKRKEAIRRLRDLIDLAAYYQVPVLIGKYRGMVGDQSGCTLGDLQNIIEKAGQWAEDAGIDIYIEPQSEDSINNLNTVSECIAWINSLNCGNIKLLLDLYHMEQTEESIVTSLLKAINYIGMIHMSDTERLVPGYGRIPVKEVLSTLDTIGYQGYLSMEIKQHPSTLQAAELSLLSLRYMKEL